MSAPGKKLIVWKPIPIVGNNLISAIATTTFIYFFFFFIIFKTKSN